MIKKILSAIFAFVMLGSVANAAGVEPLKHCVAYRDDHKSWATSSGAVVADYAIFFENDKDEMDFGKCSGEIDKLVEHIKQSAGGKPQENIEGVIVLGMADGVGSADYNAKLAKGRANTVSEYLQSQGIPICDDYFTGELDEYGNPIYKPGRCGVTTMGDAVARVFESMESNPGYRAVILYVIYKSDVCDADTIKVLDQLIAKVFDNADLKKAKELCDKEGKTLVRSQREQIQAAIRAAIEKYPEVVDQIDLSAEMKIQLLVNGLVNTRNSLAGGASVWKTAEGNFNGARLASDSIAGVVLGTAGGLITSNIVKKNQLSSGFDSVMCTIGGQTVASYGDEFRVGITTR